MDNLDVVIAAKRVFDGSVRKISVGRVDLGVGAPVSRKGGGGTDYGAKDFTIPTA